MQAFSELDEADPHLEGQRALLSLWNQLLNLVKNYFQNYSNLVLCPIALDKNFIKAPCLHNVN